MARIGENTPPNEGTGYHHSNEYQVESRPQERRNEDERKERRNEDEYEKRRNEDEHEDRGHGAPHTRCSTLELLAAGAAIVLTIVGLTCNLTLLMCAIATIAIGVALFAHGAAVAACWNETVRRAAPGHRHEFATGVGCEMLGGLAGGLLGVFALANCEAFVLIPIALIVFGGAILLGAHAQTSIAAVQLQIGRLTIQAVEVTRSAMVLAGVGAVVLGICGLIHLAHPLTLSLIALLIVGSALVLVGCSLSARFGRILHHHEA